MTFVVGQRVRLSERGKDVLTSYHTRMKPDAQGAVKRLVPPQCVSIHVDGFEKPVTYHIDFWEAL